LGLAGGDLAATTLPLQYCYGLSVLNSHLVSGGGVLLTDRSVVDERFWDEFRAEQATSFAGVPYTFDLLDSSGFADRDLPSLRYVTAAGGRLDPERVGRYARLGRDRGFDLVVMYGQTEATARMAYLPPGLAAERPATIGVPVPGGSFRLDPLDPADPGSVGELVYRGRNVMLGYATSAHDLAQGRTVHELRTGDLAVQHEDGLYEVVGRRSRLAKVFGLRVDLDDLERRLESHDEVRARAVEDDGRVALFVTRHLDAETARQAAVRAGVPFCAVRAHVVASFPLTDRGKVDYSALVRHAEVLRRSEAAAGEDADAGSRHVTCDARAVRDLYAELLGRPDATDEDSFVSLHGDSLSFVEASVRLDELLGVLPEGWPDLSAHRLAAEARHVGGEGSGQGSRWAHVEVPLLLRAAAITLVVASHANVLSVLGGAHVLLALAGFSLARFQLSGGRRAERCRSLLRAAREIAVPSALWIGGVALTTGRYDLGTVALANNLLGSPTWDVRWQFWFLEAVVWSLVAVAGLVSVPALDRLERRRPFSCALGVVALTLLLRLVLVGVHAGPTERYALPVVLWCIALGWLAARSETTTHRVLASAAAAGATYGFFGDVIRETLVVAGILCLVWVRTVRFPRALLRPVTLLASSSLFVYLTHWQVYPHLEDGYPLLATLASFAVGIGAHRAYAAVRSPGTRRLRTRARRAPSPTGRSPRRRPAPR
ncbi:MAG TPA: AMP-binding protein, partial [Nocardioidaceae bacterium]|nr:AMP-binding protein [Nocardioidaceae bacterium]